MPVSQVFLLACILASISLQVAAAIMALRLIGVSGGLKAWIFIALAISLMAVRRGVSLSWLFSGQPLPPRELGFELLGLVTSVLMLIGMALIRPLFQSIRAAEVEREKLIGELQTALANIKTLRGFLPICASCKKIRDDKGYWNQVESYIRKHTDVKFSHGICPECAKSLYPEYYRPLSGEERAGE